MDRLNVHLEGGGAGEGEVGGGGGGGGCGGGQMKGGHRQQRKSGSGMPNIWQALELIESKEKKSLQIAKEEPFG